MNEDSSMAVWGWVLEHGGFGEWEDRQIAWYTIEYIALTCKRLWAYIKPRMTQLKKATLGEFRVEWCSTSPEALAYKNDLIIVSPCEHKTLYPLKCEYFHRGYYKNNKKVGVFKLFKDRRAQRHWVIEFNSDGDPCRAETWNRNVLISDFFEE